MTKKTIDDFSYEDLKLTPRTFSKRKLLHFSNETLAVARVVPIGLEKNCVMPSATGFFLKLKDRKLFVTNKHVVTARDFFRPNMHLFHGATPGKLILSCFLVFDLQDGKRIFRDALYELELFDSVGNPRFFCPNPLGETDIAVIDLGSAVVLDAEFGEGTFQFLHASPLPTQAMDATVVVGYPETGIYQKTGFPIFKSGIIASEPDVDFYSGLVLIDANTKSGMSGSPVLHKPPNIFEANCGVIGVYSGRDEDGKITGNSELGLMWPIQSILDQLDSIPRCGG